MRARVVKKLIWLVVVCLVGLVPRVGLASISVQTFVSSNNKLYIVIQSVSSGAAGSQVTSFTITGGSVISAAETANNPPDPNVTALGSLLSGVQLGTPATIKRTAIVTGLTSNVIENAGNPLNGVFTKAGDGFLTFPGGLRTTSWDNSGTESVTTADNTTGAATTLVPAMDTTTATRKFGGVLLTSASFRCFPEPVGTIVTSDGATCTGGSNDGTACDPTQGDVECTGGGTCTNYGGVATNQNVTIDNGLGDRIGNPLSQTSTVDGFFLADTTQLIVFIIEGTASTNFGVAAAGFLVSDDDLATRDVVTSAAAQQNGDFNTATVTNTPTRTSTATVTTTFTQTATRTATNTATPTNTPTSTQTLTASSTGTITQTPTITHTFTPPPTVCVGAASVGAGGCCAGCCEGFSGSLVCASTPIATFTQTDTPTTTPTATPTITGNTPTVTITPTVGPCVEEVDFATGCYVGDGVDDRQILSCFEPDFFWTQQKGSPGGANFEAMFWTRDFGTDSKDFSGGVLTNDGLKGPQPVGMVIGVNPLVNQTSQPYCFAGFKNNTEWAESKTYIGIGGPLYIPLPFAPQVVMIIPTTGVIWGRMANATIAHPFNEPIGSTDGQTAITMGPLNGFTVNQNACLGASCSVNKLGEQYAYVALGLKENYTYGTVRDGASGSLSSDYTAIPATGCESIAMLLYESGYVLGTSAPQQNSDVCRMWAIQNDIGCTFLAMTGDPPTGAGSTCGALDSLVNNIGWFQVRNNGSGRNTACDDSDIEYNWFAVCSGSSSTALPVNSFINQGSEYPCQDNFPSQAAEDWTDDGFVAIWTGAGEVTGDPAVALGSCGADCTLTDHNTVGRDTTIKLIGENSFDFTSASSEYLSCALATCDELDVGGASTNYLSIGAWARPKTIQASPLKRYFLSKGDNAVSGDDYSFGLLRNVIPDRPWRAALRADTGGAGTLNSYNLSTLWNANEWRFGSISFDNVANTVRGCRASTSGALAFSCPSSSPFSSNMTTGTTGEFDLGRMIVTAAEFWDGYVNQPWIYTGVPFGSRDMCRIASCGVDGSLCSCYVVNPILYKDTGLNSLIGNCQLPACNKAAPG